MPIGVTRASSPSKERSGCHNQPHEQDRGVIETVWPLCPRGSSGSSFPRLLLVILVLCVLLLLNFMRKLLPRLWSTEVRASPGFIFLACCCGGKKWNKKKIRKKWKEKKKKATRFCWFWFVLTQALMPPGTHYRWTSSLPSPHPRSPIIGESLWKGCLVQFYIFYWRFIISYLLFRIKLKKKKHV